MAKWRTNEFHVSSKTVNPDSGLHGKFELDTGEGIIKQDLTKFLRDAELERERQEVVGQDGKHYRKFATIPDAVAIKIKEDYGLDLHDPNFMKDKDKLERFKAIFASEYSKLVINKQ